MREKNPQVRGEAVPATPRMLKIEREYTEYLAAGVAETDAYAALAGFYGCHWTDVAMTVLAVRDAR